MSAEQDRFEDCYTERPATCFDFVPNPDLISKEGVRMIYERHPGIKFPHRTDPNLPTVGEIQMAYVAGKLTDSQEYWQNLISFGDDIESFYIACAYVNGCPDEAADITMHELQHARELARHDVPFAFTMLFARKEDGGLDCFQSVTALYPPHFTEEDKRKVRIAVLETVENSSEEDSMQLAHQRQDNS